MEVREVEGREGKKELIVKEGRKEGQLAASLLEDETPLQQVISQNVRENVYRLLYQIQQHFAG